MGTKKESDLARRNNEQQSSPHQSPFYPLEAFAYRDTTSTGTGGFNLNEGRRGDLKFAKNVIHIIAQYMHLSQLYIFIEYQQREGEGKHGVS